MRAFTSIMPLAASFLASTSLAAHASDGNETSKPELKILPLGASIVFGTGTSAGNRYAGHTSLDPVSRSN